MNKESIDTLLSVIRSADEDTARNHLIKHINMLAEHLIESSWSKAMNFMRFQNKNRKKRLSAFVLEENEFDGSISHIDFLRFHSSVVDYVRSNADIHTDVNRFAEEIEDFLYLKTGSIRLDRRSLFQKEND